MSLNNRAFGTLIWWAFQGIFRVPSGPQTKDHNCAKMSKGESFKIQLLTKTQKLTKMLTLIRWVFYWAYDQCGNYLMCRWILFLQIRSISPHNALEPLINSDQFCKSEIICHFKAWIHNLNRNSWSIQREGLLKARKQICICGYFTMLIS